VDIWPKLDLALKSGIGFCLTLVDTCGVPNPQLKRRNRRSSRFSKISGESTRLWSCPPRSGY